MGPKKHLFATDSYHLKHIKAQEMLIGGNSETTILTSPATRKLYDFKMFLANDDNSTEWSIGSLSAGEKLESSADLARPLCDKIWPNCPFYDTSMTFGTYLDFIITKLC